MKNKKAGLDNAIYLVVALFALAIIFIVGNLIIKEVDDNFQEGDIISEQGKAMTGNLRARYVSIIDNAFLFLFVGLIIAITIGAWFTRIHPALFWVSIPILAFIIFLAAIYGNVFNVISTDSLLSKSASDFVILTFILNNYVYFIVGVVLLVSAALYAKNREGNIF